MKALYFESHVKSNQSKMYLYTMSSMAVGFSENDLFWGCLQIAKAACPSLNITGSSAIMVITHIANPIKTA